MRDRVGRERRLVPVQVERERRMDVQARVQDERQAGFLGSVVVPGRLIIRGLIR